MLTRWNDTGLVHTWAVMDSVRKQFDRLFGELDVDHGLFTERHADWLDVPRVNVREEESAYVVEADIPGLRHEDLEINLEKGVLTIQGERKTEAPEGFRVHRRERSNLRFKRSFTLPRDVDAEKANAELKNGVLTLTLPKAAAAQPRQIPVHVG